MRFPGGTWSGSDSLNGSCTYAANSAVAIGACGADAEYEVFITSGFETSSDCDSGSVSTPPSPEAEDADDSKKHVEKNSDEPVTLVLGGGKNGDATFPPETCSHKCTISSNLPGPAKGSMPGDAVATMYVRVVDEGGGQGTGTYLVCFNNPDGKPLTIYRFVSGAWVAMTFASSSNRICVSASGDGAFYLGN